jgi:MerC mercury resistance protein
VPAEPQTSLPPPRGASASPVGTRLERAAAWLSAACAVHCLLLPLGAALLPVLGVSAFGSLGRSVDLALLLLVVAGGAGSALLGFRRHRDLRLSLIMAGCVVLYLIGHGLGEQAWYGRALAISGGLGLALASFTSARLGHTHAPGTCAH